MMESFLFDRKDKNYYFLYYEDAACITTYVRSRAGKPVFT